MPVHLHPTAPLAERVLLPGDPGRALTLAQQLMVAPRMFNHHRGLWGYTGEALLDGAPLTVQATGMGGPSAAIVISELVSLGARSLLRLGTCGAFTSGPELGEVVLVSAALSADGTSRALGATERTNSSADLLARLRSAAPAPKLREVLAVSTDLFYDTRPDRVAGWVAAGASVVEMETATLFTLGGAHRVSTGALLIVTGLEAPGRTPQRIDDDVLAAAVTRFGEIAMRALRRG